METMLMHIAAGRSHFMGYPLSYPNRKCLFISLEEGGKLDRYKRNQNQISGYREQEIASISNNYIVSTPFMPTHLIDSAHWQKIEDAIVENKPCVVVLDSLNRLTADSNADEEIAKKITMRLMELVKKYGITLFVINHTTKVSNEALQTGSCMSGSRIYGSEADFLIAVNRLSTNARYVKLVFSRHDRDDSETVDQYKITDKQWVELINKVPEYSLFKPQDGRTDDTNVELVWQEIESIADKAENGQFRPADLEYLYEGEARSMSKVTFFKALEKMVTHGRLVKPSKGIYQVIN